MDINQIILLIIIILVSLIVVFGVYNLIVYLLNKKREKKIDTIFNPNNLVEEESLMNVMDEKRNLEYKEPVDKERFVQNVDEVNVVTSEAMTREEQVNPFGVDMTIRNKDNTKVEIQDPDNHNRFIK